MQKTPESVQAVQAVQDQVVTNPIFESLDSLQNALINLHPQLPTILQKILHNLKDHPATVTLLTDDQIAKILEGFRPKRLSPTYWMIEKIV